MKRRIGLCRFGYACCLSLIWCNVLAVTKPGPGDYITEYYLDGAKSKPVLVYQEKDDMDESALSADMIKKRKVSCKLTKSVKIWHQADISDTGYSVIIIMPGQDCFQVRGYVKTSQIREKVYYYLFRPDNRDKAELSTKNSHISNSIRTIHKYDVLIYLSRLYKRVHKFKLAKGKADMIVNGEHGNYFEITVKKDFMEMRYKMSGIDSLGRYPCGCVSFFLTTYYPDRYYRLKIKNTNKTRKMRFLKSTERRDKNGKLILEKKADTREIARKEYTVRSFDRLVRIVDRLKSDKKYSESTEAKLKWIEVRNYNGSGRLLGKYYINALSYLGMDKDFPR